MKRTPLRRKARLATKSRLRARKRIKAKARSNIEFQRIYGSQRRVEFVKNLPCVVCTKKPSENAHIKSGGMGRKADYTQIIPLCASCHRLQHEKGWKALGLDAMLLDGLAYSTQWMWATRDTV